MVSANIHIREYLFVLLSAWGIGHVDGYTRNDKDYLEVAEAVQPNLRPVKLPVFAVRIGRKIGRRCNPTALRGVINPNCAFCSSQVGDFHPVLDSEFFAVPEPKSCDGHFGSGGRRRRRRNGRRGRGAVMCARSAGIGRTRLRTRARWLRRRRGKTAALRRARSARMGRTRAHRLRRRRRRGKAAALRRPIRVGRPNLGTEAVRATATARPSRGPNALVRALEARLLDRIIHVAVVGFEQRLAVNADDKRQIAALWEYFGKCEDFEERIAFAVSQRPHLFSLEIVKPVQELLAEWFPEKARREFALHVKLDKHDTVVRYWSLPGPSWDKIQDIINSLVCLAPRREGDRSFPPIEPISWFDMVRVLGRQYQSQNKGKKSSWRPGVSLAAAHQLGDNVLGKEFPPLNLELLPEYAQCAVKRFCQATEGEGLSCNTYIYRSDSWQTWGQLDVKYRTGYAAAYALLYSTDIVPLLSDDNDEICGTCGDIRLLYDCVDAVSAGQITLRSQDIAKVLDFIKQLAVISDDCKFTFPEETSDVDDFDNRSESSERPDDQQRAGNSEVIHDETHNAAIVTENEMNPFNPKALTQPEASFGWQEPHSATQIYNFTHQAPLIEYTTMIEGHASAQEHVREFTNIWDPPREDSEHLPFRVAIPDSSLGVAGLGVVPEPNWSNEQPPEFLTTSNITGPSRPKDNVGPKISKEAMKKELHAFFVNLFKKHNVPLGTTGMAEARLPWRKMTIILADQGLEVVGWPDGVPKPRSDGKADKGISGFNMKHIGALYEAMKAGQIDLKPLAGGSQTHDGLQVRQRDGEMEDEVEIRPSKKAKLAGTRKLPKAFVAGKSVMKF
ncbi:hypothetical protein C8R44DRAFT_912963 [Mycena epipterygia]|nr:hypothetical protein C8R44DRAFT_912963 [Mycena epipterygia]